MDMPIELKLILFDFDQTLTVVHVWKLLAGCEPEGQNGVEVSPPYSRTQLGQMARLNRFITPENPRGLHDFALLVFGGTRRVEAMQQILSGLHERSIEIRICTRGFVGAVKMLLQAVDLLKYFPTVHGVVDVPYDDYLPYDIEIMDRSLSNRLAVVANCLGCSCVSSRPVRKGFIENEMLALRGRTRDGQWGLKRTLVNELLSERQWPRDAILLVDDDPMELDGAQCSTLLVSERSGLTREQWLQIGEMVGVRPNGDESDSDCMLF